MRLLGARDLRALVAGALVIGGSTILARGLPFRRATEQELRDRIVATGRAADALQRERDLLSRAVADAGARGATETARLRDLVFDGESPTAQGAQAAQYAAGIARLHGASVHSVAPSADTTFADGVAPLTVRLHLTTDGIGLYQLVDELVLGPRLATVRYLQVALENPSADAGVPEALRVELGFTALGQSSGGRVP